MRHFRRHMCACNHARLQCVMRAPRRCSVIPRTQHYFVKGGLSSREGCTSRGPSFSTGWECSRRYWLQTLALISARKRQYNCPANLTLPLRSIGAGDIALPSFIMFSFDDYAPFNVCCCWHSAALLIMHIDKRPAYRPPRTRRCIALAKHHRFHPGYFTWAVFTARLHMTTRMLWATSMFQRARENSCVQCTWRPSHHAEVSSHQIARSRSSPRHTRTPYWIAY